MTPNPTSRLTPEIAYPLRDAFLKGVNQNDRGPRKKGRYSTEEKEVLNKYKHDYRKTTTTEERYDLLRNRILVDIFNFWYAKGEVTPNIEPELLSNKIRTLSVWIRNNWRSYHNARGLGRNERKKSRVDVVWMFMKEKVMEEINAMVKEDGGEGEATAVEIFRYRTSAAKRVFESLSMDDQSIIQKKIEDGGDNVPVNIKQMRAMRMAGQVIAKAAKKNWKDMGLFTLSFFGFIKPNGKITVETHDNMAGHMGNTTRRFFDVYDELVDNVQHKMVEYIKTLQPSSNIHQNLTRPDLLVSSNNGYPWMPPSVGDIDRKKNELEKLVRTYLNNHYKLASGNRKNHIPFSNLCSNSTDFIDNCYVPTAFVWKDPRNLTKDALIELCNHICERQDKYGPEGGFRFKSYFNGKEMVDAEYGIRVDEKKTAARSNKQRKQRKAKEKKGKKSLENLDHIPTYPTPDDVVTSNPYVPQIDPQLLGEAGTNTVTPRTTETNCEGRYVDDAEMQILLANGHPLTIPINGPNDGPPRYFISAAANIITRPTTESDPILVPKEKPRRSKRIPNGSKSVKSTIANGGFEAKMTTRSQNKKGMPSKK